MTRSSRASIWIVVAASTWSCRDARDVPEPAASHRFECEFVVDGGRSSWTAIRVDAGDGAEPERLELSTPVALDPGETPAIETPDLNQDGALDLEAIVARGATNTYADYWVFDRASHRFTALGTFPIFTIDAARRELECVENGGHGGMIHERKTYRFDGGRLTLERWESQTWSEEEGAYRPVVREMRDGGMRVVAEESILPDDR